MSEVTVDDASDRYNHRAIAASKHVVRCRFPGAGAAVSFKTQKLLCARSMRISLCHMHAHMHAQTHARHASHSHRRRVRGREVEVESE